MALPALPAGGPYTLKVRGTNTLTFGGRLGGRGLGRLRPVQHGVSAAAVEGRRRRRRARLLRPAPVHGREPAGRGARRRGGAASGSACDAANAAAFSAAAFHFGRELHRALGVAVGIVQASVGRHARRGVDAARGAARRADAGADGRGARSRDERTPRCTTSWPRSWPPGRRGTSIRTRRTAARSAAGRAPAAAGWETMDDPAAVGERGPGDRRRRLVPARGDRARGVGGRRAGAVAGRDRRLRRHLLERRARRRDRRGDAAVLGGAAALRRFPGGW